jgi:hypothetical protein
MRNRATTHLRGDIFQLMAIDARSNMSLLLWSCRNRLTYYL